MDSPHSLPQTSTATGFVPFYPINFLVTTQKVHIYSLYIVILARASEKMRCWLVRKCCFVCSNNEIRIYTTWLSLLVYSDTLYILVHFLHLFPDFILSSPSYSTFPAFLLSRSLPINFLLFPLCLPFSLPFFSFLPTYLWCLPTLMYMYTSTYIGLHAPTYQPAYLLYALH